MFFQSCWSPWPRLGSVAGLQDRHPAGAGPTSGGPAAERASHPGLRAWLGGERSQGSQCPPYSSPGPRGFAQDPDSLRPTLRGEVGQPQMPGSFPLRGGGGRLGWLEEVAVGKRVGTEAWPPPWGRRLESWCVSWDRDARGSP